ncbi:MAG: hypothetical protein JWN27_2886 [Candidatus Eremiobacteraeota bacterium]|nr:hypothetical protein [Candidatus Eremiobacteraeota bacterium]
MKRLIAGLALAAGLAACGGGGGSSPVPGPVATPTPSSQPVTYAAHIRWTGAMAPVGALATQGLRHTSSTATPLPVMIAAQVCDLGQNCNNLPYSNEGYPTHGAIITIDVSPAPSPSVAPSFAPVTGPAALASPQASPSPGTLAVTSTKAAGQDQVSVTVPISGSPVTQTTTIEIYPGIAMGCGPAYTGLTSGASFSGGTMTSVTDPAVADVYVSGPYCTGNFYNATEAATTFHAPGGATLLAADTVAFIDIGSAAWRNDFIATPLTQLPPTGTTKWMLLVKTPLSYVKFSFVHGGSADSVCTTPPLAPTCAANGSAGFTGGIAGSIEGSWEQSGSSIDGKF